MEKNEQQTVVPVGEVTAQEVKEKTAEVTGQGKNPEEAQGNKEVPGGRKDAGKKRKGIEEALEEAGKKMETKRKKELDFIAPYAKAYPQETAFHVTADRQVFLGKDLGLAKNHQRTLKEGELRTIKVR